MTESKVFTDNFSRSFTEPGDFFRVYRKFGGFLFGK